VTSAPSTSYTVPVASSGHIIALRSTILWHGLVLRSDWLVLHYSFRWWDRKRKLAASTATSVPQGGTTHQESFLRSQIQPQPQEESSKLTHPQT